MPVVTGSAGAFWGVSFADGSTYVVDAARGEVLHGLRTEICMGGPRLALTRDGSQVATSECESRGVFSYDAKVGSVLWQREDLTDVMAIAYVALVPLAGLLLVPFITETRGRPLTD